MMMPNPRAPLDAAIASSSLFEHHWRRANVSCAWPIADYWASGSRKMVFNRSGGTRRGSER
jgi:hypothetical protein